MSHHEIALVRIFFVTVAIGLVWGWWFGWFGNKRPLSGPDDTDDDTPKPKD